MEYLNTIVQGVLLGGLYALYAAGLSLIFGVMRLINLAHGDLIVLAAFVLLAMVTALGLPLPIALLILLPFAFALGSAALSAQPHPGPRYPPAAPGHFWPANSHSERASGRLQRR